jgi:hypothetical protein
MEDIQGADKRFEGLFDETLAAGTVLLQQVLKGHPAEVLCHDVLGLL